MVGRRQPLSELPVSRPALVRKSGMPRWTVVCRAARSRMAASFCSAAARLGLDRGDLAEPALFLGLLEPVEQVRVDLLQVGPLLGIWS